MANSKKISYNLAKSSKKNHLQIISSIIKNKQSFMK